METQSANSAARLDARGCAGVPREPRIPPPGGKVLLTPGDPSGPLQGCWRRAGCWGASQMGGCFPDGSWALPRGPQKQSKAASVSSPSLGTLGDTKPGHLPSFRLRAGQWGGRAGARAPIDQLIN